LILKGLCDDGYIERITDARGNTKAFKLIDMDRGLAAYSEEEEEISEITECEAALEAAGYSPQGEPVEKRPEPKPEPQPSAPLASLQLRELAPLLAEHDKAQESVKEYDQWLTQCGIDLEAKGKEIEDLDAKMAPLIVRRAEAVKEREDLKKQQTEMEAARKEEETKVLTLREKLRSAIGG
jgi:chromosome segregation ATPase